jgi:hypothetical protein
VLVAPHRDPPRTTARQHVTIARSPSEAAANRSTCPHLHDRCRDRVHDACRWIRVRASGTRPTACISERLSQRRQVGIRQAAPGARTAAWSRPNPGRCQIHASILPRTPDIRSSLTTARSTPGPDPTVLGLDPPKPHPIDAQQVGRTNPTAPATPAALVRLGTRLTTPDPDPRRRHHSRRDPTQRRRAQTQAGGTRLTHSSPVEPNPTTPHSDPPHRPLCPDLRPSPPTPLAGIRTHTHACVIGHRGQPCRCRQLTNERKLSFGARTGSLSVEA